MVAYSAAGAETQNGVSGPYTLNGISVPSAAAPSPAPGLASRPELNFAEQFHANLRNREVELSRSPGRRLPSAGAAVRRLPPVLGSQDTFKVCGNVNCSAGSFVNVAATARFVGPRGAIYLDNTVPAGGLTQEDIDSLGSLFDGDSPNIYGIDTTAFGRESDLDGNGVVIVLLSDAVNALSGTCPNNQIILGYFFGLDLVSDPNSNGGEIFYGLVPNPTATNCRVSRNDVLGFLPPVLIHELQHMISFNQHVLVRSGSSEQTWLNEGLSHFAEELGGRRLPDSRCPLFSSCLAQFAVIGNIPNGFEYLQSPESHFLVYPASSFGTLQERGASWLFVRWLADNEAGDTLLGTDLTQALVRTNRVGAGNVAAVTGATFEQLTGQWQMANYLERLPGFTDATGRLKYRTWDLAGTFSSLGAEYPLNPDSTTGAYTRNGTLRAGSGRHLLVIQGANAAPIDLQLKGDSRFGTLVPRFAVVRIQ
jgi:hypothetical protein